MFRRKNIRFFLYLILGVIICVIGIFFYNAQKESRDFYRAVKNGKQAEATVYELSTVDYSKSETNKYGYIFIVDGKAYVATTLRPYSAAIKDKPLLIRYAVDKDDNVRLNGEDKAKVNGQEYPIALSFEEGYFSFTTEPSVTSSIVIFVLAGVVLGFALYNVIWIWIYKNVESKGELTYGMFVSAAVSRFGPAKYMSVVYKYQNQSGEWIEAKTPYTYNALDAEKLKFLETFKIRYKGKRSVIAEDVRGLRL